MKQIHFPTLALHAILLLLAGWMLNDYADGFLFLSGGLLFFHVIRSCAGSSSMALSHVLGCAVQTLIFGLKIINISRGPLGLGGGEFARFFYLIGLAGTALTELGIVVIRHFLSKK